MQHLWPQGHPAGPRQIRLSNSHASSGHAPSSSLRKTARAQFVLSLVAPEGAFGLLPQMREQSAVRRRATACPCKEHGTDPAGPASPYGAPLRRFQSLGPRFPLAPVGLSAPGRGKERALGVILRREADPRTPGTTVCENRGRRRRSPLTFVAPRNAPRRTGMRPVYSESETMSIAKLYRR